MKEKIGLKIRTLSHMIRRGIDDKINSSGLSEITGVQGFVIGYLYSNRNRDIFQRDLEKQFNLRRSSITSVLNNLEKKAYIRREEVNNDKRLKKVVLTAKGMEHQDKIFLQHIPVYDTLLRPASVTYKDKPVFKFDGATRFSITQ